MSPFYKLCQFGYDSGQRKRVTSRREIIHILMNTSEKQEDQLESIVGYCA